MQTNHRSTKCKYVATGPDGSAPLSNDESDGDRTIRRQYGNAVSASSHRTTLANKIRSNKIQINTPFMLHNKYSTFLYLSLLLEFTGIPGLSLCVVPPPSIFLSIYIGLSITRSWSRARALPLFLSGFESSHRHIPLSLNILLRNYFIHPVCVVRFSGSCNRMNLH